MAEVIVFGDVVEAFCDYLRDELEDRGYTLTVATQVPTTRPATLVRVLRTGGVRNVDFGIPTEQAQLTFECWAATQAASHDLAQTTRALVHASRGVVDNVSRIEEAAGPGYLPDPLSDVPRYSFTCLVTWRGATEPGS